MIFKNQKEKKKGRGKTGWEKSFGRHSNQMKQFLMKILLLLGKKTEKVDHYKLL